LSETSNEETKQPIAVLLSGLTKKFAYNAVWLTKFAYLNMIWHRTRT